MSEASEKVRGLLDHLGIRKAHFALHGFELGWPELVRSLEDRIAGLALVIHADNPNVSVLAPLASRVIAIAGEQRAQAVEEMYQRLAALPIGRLVALKAYTIHPWSDVAKEPAFASELASFFKGLGGADGAVAPTSGEHDGLTYRIEGSGPPLVLFPLSLAASQWEPALPALQQQFTTIVLGGPYIGAVANLEFRASGSYMRTVRNLLIELGIEPGQSVLEVGCGSGALVRYVAKQHPDVAITALDVNRYLLGEAAALAERDGVGDRITFREGDACALPFPDGSFDRVFSSTVMEEVDADKMMAELVRVTKPGGRVGVQTRSVDRPRWVNISVPPELRAKVDYISGSVVHGGCADASLYERFPRAGLRDVQAIPQVAVDERTTPSAVEQALASRLNEDERRQFSEALQQAVKTGTFFVAATFHAAVGTKP